MGVFVFIRDFGEPSRACQVAVESVQLSAHELCSSRMRGVELPMVVIPGEGGGMEIIDVRASPAVFRM
jgi:hypothetical protein